MESFEKIIDNAKTLSLSRQERDSARARITSFMRDNPAPGAAHAGFALFTFMRKPVSAVLVLVLLLVGSLSYAAEGSLPGDALYTVKVGINERVAGSFTFSDEAKANFEAHLAGKRLEEAEELAAQGRMNTQMRAHIESNFDAYAARVEDRIEKFRESKNTKAAADVASNFETSLHAHGKILSRLAARADLRDGVNPIAERVRAKNSSVAKERAELELKLSAEISPDAKAAAEGKLGVAEKKISNVRAFFARKKDGIGASIALDVEARLARADEIVRAGKVKLGAGLYGEAFVLFQQAHRSAEEARIIIAVRASLKIDVRIDGDDHDTDAASTSDAQDSHDEHSDRGGEKSDIELRVKSDTETENAESHGEKQESESHAEGRGSVNINLGF